MSYLDTVFTDKINKNEVSTIFELGSRDLVDANKLSKFYNSVVFAFECNPDCLKICEENILKFTNDRIKAC